MGRKGLSPHPTAALQHLCRSSPTLLKDLEVRIVSSPSTETCPHPLLLAPWSPRSVLRDYSLSGRGLLRDGDRLTLQPPPVGRVGLHLSLTGSWVAGRAALEWPEGGASQGGRPGEMEQALPGLADCKVRAGV